MSSPIRPGLEPENFQGAMALLRDCVGGRKGEKLLIVSEEAAAGLYDAQAPKLVADAGIALGMQVFESQTKSYINNESEVDDFVSTLIGYDHIVFFSRVGDQIRFSKNPQLPPSTMCYTLNSTALNSSFGTACYSGMGEIKQAIDLAFSSASSIRVTCPRGTDFKGGALLPDAISTEVSVKRFPLLVPRPITTSGFTGRVALSRFLVGTGSRYYDPYHLPLPNDVYALIENKCITRFEGADADIKLVEDHYYHVSQQFNIDPWCVDSWHAGIHPGCHFESDAEEDILRWSGSAFGSPRILHFHTCGDYAPGEISWHVLDPTVTLDGVAIWENGRLYPERLSTCEDILQRHPNLAFLFANPARDIGLHA